MGGWRARHRRLEAARDGARFCGARRRTPRSACAVLPGRWLVRAQTRHCARARSLTRIAGSPRIRLGRATALTGSAIAGWPLLLSLLEQLAKSRQLLRVENCFDLLVGAFPDGAHLGRWPSRSRTAACAIGRRTIATTPTPTAPSTASSTAPSAAPSAAPSSALTSSIFSEVLHRHCFVGDHRTDFGLLRGIELQRFRHPRHPQVDHLTGIHSFHAGRTLRILALGAGARCESDTPEGGCANYRSERQTPSSLGNLPSVHCFLVAICCEISR